MNKKTILSALTVFLIGVLPMRLAGEGGHAADDELALAAAMLANQARVGSASASGTVATLAAAVEPEDSIQAGSWGSVINWTPHIPVSAANLPDGRILTFASNQRTSFPVGPEFTYAATWNPATGAFQEFNHDSHDMFCGGITLMADGRVMVNGGRNETPFTSIFDWRTNTWTRVQNMNGGRWYNTSVSMPNGQVFTATGSGTGINTTERWSTTGWTQLTGIPWPSVMGTDAGYFKHWHPFASVAPDGRILHFGPTDTMHWFNIGGVGSFVNAGTVVPGVHYPKEGSFAMFDEGRVLVAGGSINANASSIDSSIGVSTTAAYVVDMRTNPPTATPTSPMAFPRQFANAVVLPSGEVLVMGGNSPGRKFSDEGSILPCEIWNPRTGAWRTVASISVPRNYHSLALLLPDGRVMSGGGGLGGGDHRDVQLFTPPSLFTATGTAAVRPTLAAAPTVVAPGSVFSVTGTAGLVKFAFLRMAALTHSVNTDQRYLSLPFSETVAGTYQVNAHANVNVMVPGYWMLFGINASGAYSVAKVIHVDPTAGITLTNLVSQSATVGVATTLQVTATAPAGTTITYAATGLPTGLVMNSSTGRIAGTPTASGVFNVTVTASGGGLNATQTFSWTALLANTGSGTILREWWTGVGSGILVSDLTANAAYPNNPTGSDQRTSFETPTDWADNLGQRVRGYIHPPVSGQYRFWIASDDEGQLRLSTDRQPANSTVVARVSQWSGSREWTKFPEQTSVLVTLQAGQSYYVEALMKEGGGGDNLAVAWATPGTSTPVVIAGQYLSPWVNNRVPVLINPGNRIHVVGTTVALNVSASDADADPLTYSASGLPTGLSIQTTTGSITGTPTTPGTYNVTVSVTDSRSPIVSAAFTWTINPVVNLNPPAASPPSATGAALNYTAGSTGGANVRYKWSWGDGTPDSVFSASPSATHTFAAPGRYQITLTATDDSGRITTATFFQGIHAPLSTRRPTSSSSLVLEDRPTGTNDRIWCVNGDNDSVSVFDAVTRTRLAETPVGTAPRSLAIAPDGRVWVTNVESSSVSILSPSTLAVVQTLTLARGARPFGVVFDPDGTDGWIACEGTGILLRMNPSTGAQTGSLNVGLNARHLSVLADSSRVLVTRFVTPPLPGENTASVSTPDTAGAQVLSILTSTLTVEKTSILLHSTRPDTITTGRGIPNYLGPAIVSPDGLTAWVPSKQDNIKRGMLRDGFQLTHDQTVRSIASRLTLVNNVPANTDDMLGRVDFDNAGIASNGSFERTGLYLFTALEGSREIGVVDVWGKKEIKRFAAGRAPQGVVTSPEGRTVFALNFMDRTITVHDVGPLIDGADATPTLVGTMNCITTEKLTPTVLLGKKHFYDATDPRIAFQQYISCASCHNDGAHDGRTWDFTGFGEGLRNTISLRGHGGMAQGPLHWTGNFDELQDFENQIRNLNVGTGLISSGNPHPPMGTANAGRSADLDALAAYMTSLSSQEVSPFRTAGGGLTAEATAGKTVFENANCAQCHSGAPFTNSALNVASNIGTVKSTTGQRLGTALTGLDVPTLRGLWATAPYLHDGTAATVTAAVQAHQGVNLSAADLNNLTAYLLQIDAGETFAPALAAPVLSLSAPSSATGPFGVNVSANQIVTGLVASDFVITNGTATSLTGAGFSYVLQVTPAAPGTVSISLPVGRCVNAANIGNTASNSVSVSYTSSGLVLTSGDVGPVIVPGSTSLSGGLYTLTAAGEDIYFNQDGLRFAYQQVTGDGEIIARVTSQTNTNPWAKAGVMIRETLDAGSRHATAFTTPIEAANGYGLVWRPTANGSTDYAGGPGLNAAPNNWVRLVRAGTTITAYESANGTAWTEFASIVLPSLSNTVYFGLALTASDNYSGNVATGTFDNVKINGAQNPTAPTVVLSTAAPTVSGPFQVTAQFSQIVTGLTASDFVVTNGAPSALTGSGLNYQVTITPSLPGLVSISLPTGAVVNGTGLGNGVSNTLGATYSQPVSGALTGVDVGRVMAPGSTSLSGGIYTLDASGDDIFFGSDGFHFAHTSINGDGEIKARVISQTNTNPWAKAGVMMREGLAAGSRHATVFTTPAETNNGFGFVSRIAANSTTSYQGPGVMVAPPNNWVRLVRTGNTLTGYVSNNGTAWAVIGSATFSSLAQTLYFGLAVTATDDYTTTRSRATFDNVQMTGSPGAPLATTTVARLSQPSSDLIPVLEATRSGDGGALSGLSFNRMSGSSLGYELHLLSDISQSPAGWRATEVLPSVSSNGDGTEHVSFAQLAAQFGNADQGFARLHMESDTDGDGFADVEKNGEVFGFNRLSFPKGITTASNPFASPALATAAIGDVANDTLSIDGGVPAFAGASCYVEITHGVHQGHRLEIDEAKSSGSRIVIETTSPRNTLKTLPATLAGDRVSVRAHRTVSEVFGEQNFVGSRNAKTADRLLFYNGTSFEILWLWMRDNGYQQWVREGDATLSDAGSRVIGVGEGLLVDIRNSPATVMFQGIVRQNPVALPLLAGSQLIGSVWPHAMSPDVLGMTFANQFVGARAQSRADQIQQWLGDSTPGASGYSLIYLLSAGSLQHWVASGDATLQSLNQTPVLGTCRAMFFKSTNRKDNYSVPQTWTP